MERIKTLIARYRQTAFFFFLGLVFIVYLSLGALYLQQAPQQRELTDQIAKLTAILRNPPPNPKVLEAELNAIDLALTPIADNNTIAMLLDIAKKSGLDISEEADKFRVPIASHGSSGPYELLSFKGIRAQGDAEAVTAFIRLLESDEMLKPPGSAAPRIVVRVVTRVTIEEIEVAKTGEEAERAVELSNIQEAVKKMMTANNITSLFYPVSFRLRKATRFMGDDPSTPEFEGFPDFTANATEPLPIGKGYTGNATPKNGYLLWEHDKITMLSDNTTIYTTTNYTQELKTKFYYTAEQDGIVYQWLTINEPALYSEIAKIPKGNKDSSPTKREFVASMDIDFYFKPK